MKCFQEWNRIFPEWWSQLERLHQRLAILFDYTVKAIYYDYLQYFVIEYEYSCFDFKIESITIKITFIKFVDYVI